MRSLALLFCALLLGATAAAHADSLAELRLPSSTIPGCVNDWGPLGTGSGVAESTCEGKAAAEWNEHAAAVNAARDTLANAANWPDKTAPLAVIGALDACAAAADAMARLYRPTPAAPHDDAAVVAWMRAWLEPSKLPIPVTIGDGFRTLATGLEKPGLRHQERNTLYGEAAMFASRESALAAERGAEVERQTDKATRAAHLAALKAAGNAEARHPQPDIGAAIAAAAGPDHPAIAAQQTAALEHALTADPGQGDYRARTRRAFAAIPDVLIGITAIALILVVVGFRRLVDRLGIRGAMGVSLLLLVALPLSWLPLALLHAVTGWPGGWLGCRCSGRRLRSWRSAERVARPRALLSRRAYPDLRPNRRRQRHWRRDPEPNRLPGIRLCPRPEGRELCGHRPRPPGSGTGCLPDRPVCDPATPVIR
jgi:hypothetical protein